MNRHISSTLATLGFSLLVACGASPSDRSSGERTRSQDVDSAAADDSNEAKKTSGGDGSAESNGANGGPGTNGGSSGQPGTNGSGTSGGQGGQNGQDGQVGRVSVNEHCCFNGKYLRCPNQNACFGGLDIEACLESCGGAGACDCLEMLKNAGPPVGCDANATPPKGVDCANGEIDL